MLKGVDKIITPIRSSRRLKSRSNSLSNQKNQLGLNKKITNDLDNRGKLYHFILN